MKKILCVVLSIIGISSLHTADGTRNLYFNTSGNTTTSLGGGATPGFWYINRVNPYDGGSGAYAIATQGNKILVAGYVVEVDVGELRTAAIVRLNGDGTLDTTFGSSGIALLNTAFFGGDLTIQTLGASAVNGITVNPVDNTILAATTLAEGGLTRRFAIVKLTANGTRDTTFQPSDQGANGGNVRGIWYITGASLTFGGNCQAWSIVIQPSDGKIVCSGFVGISGSTSTLVVRLNANGTLDTTGFNAGGTVPGMWYKADASPAAQTAYFNNSSSTTSWVFSGLALQTNGNIVVAAWFVTAEPFNRAGVLSLTSTGIIDTNFNTGGDPTFGGVIPGYYLFLAASGNFSNGIMTSVAIDTNDNIIGAGSITYSSQTCAFCTRLTPVGVLDTTFNAGGSGSGYGEGTAGCWILGPPADGTVFTNSTSGYQSVVIDAIGRIFFLANVNATTGGRNTKATIVRLTSGGKLDTTFNPSPGAGNPYGGTVPGINYFPTVTAGTPFTGFDNKPYGLSVRFNGQVLLACELNNNNTLFACASIIDKPAINRLGLLQDTDIPFNTSLAGLILTTTIDQSGKIVASGYYGTNAMAVRYTAGGARDNTFGGSTTGALLLTSLTATSSLNKIINAASNTYLATGQSNNVFTTLKLTSGGVLDTSFNSNGYVIETSITGTCAGYDMYLNGAALSVAGVTNTNSPSILNYNSLTGARNNSLGINGYQVFTGLLGTGVMYGINTTTGALRYGAGQGTGSSLAFVRGLIDTTGLLQDTASPFNTGLNGLILTTTIDQAGKIVAGGYYGTSAMALRYTATAGRDGSTPTTFGTNGVIQLTSLTTTSSLNKIINAASNTYLATGQSNNVFTTLKLTSAGALDTSFNTNGYVIETSITGTCAGYDMYLNGAALSVAGVTNTNSPSVLNYNSSTGARDSTIGTNGYQQFPYIGTGVIYGISTTTGTLRYGAGQGSNIAFVRSLVNAAGLYQDTLSPFDAGAVGLILTTTIDQAGRLVAGGYYGTNAMAARYNVATNPPRDNTFDSDGALLLTSLTATSSLNKIINAASNTYLATGQSNNVFTTLKLTSAGALDTSFNTNGYVIETTLTGTNAGYDILLNGTALAVAGVTSTNQPSVINYNATTGARSSSIGDRGLQQFSSFGTGVMYGIQATTGTNKYGAGQASSTAFVRLLGDTSGILQDTASPLNTGLNGLILTTTIDQAGKVVVGGYYGINAMAARYNPSGNPVRDNAFDSDGALLLTSLTTTSSLNKIINAESNKYLATGQANNQFTTVKLTSAGALDTSFNSPNGFVTESTVGVSQGYDMLLNGTALAVAGVTSTNKPSVINYNATTGARTAGIGDNGWQQFSSFGTGVMYGIQATTGTNKYGAGQASSTAFVRLLGNSLGILQDTASPFNTGLNGLILTTTIDQSGKLLVGGNYGTDSQLTRYTTAGARDTFGNSSGVAFGNLATTAVINKVINFGTGYLVAGFSSSSRFTSASYLSTGLLNTAYGSGTGIVRESSAALGVGIAYDMLLNGTALAVAGFTNSNSPIVINYNSSTGVRSNTIGDNGLQRFPYLGTGVIYGINTTTGTTRYGAGQGSNIAFVRSLGNPVGVLQDTATPLNTGLSGLILTTTIDQAGKIVAGGYYSTSAMALRYTATAGRDGSGATTFGTNGVIRLTSLTTTSSLNKIINAASNTYLATGQSNNVFTTLKLTSAGALDTSFNSNGYVIETSITGTCAGYDMLLNGTALAVSGVTQTNSPSVINYHSGTGARDSSFKTNGYQQFPALGTGTIYGINTTTSTSRYGAGQASNTAFVRLLVNGTGIFQDTLAPFNTGVNGLILTTTIDQAGKIVTGGYYGTNAMATRYNVAANPPRDNTFDTDGALLLTSLTTTSSLNKIINAASNTYLATGQSNNVFTTLKITSAGALDTSFNTNGYVIETSITGTCAGYDMLLNGTALAVSGVTQTNSPSVINYHSGTGARDSSFKTNGYQQFPALGTGVIYGINTTTSTSRYGAGQASNTAFVRLLANGTGMFQDTLAPFDTGANGLILTTTIDQAGKVVVGGYYGTNAMAARYNASGTPVRDNTFDSDGALLLTSLATTSSLNKIINAAANTYLAAGQANNQFTTVKLTSAGALDTSFNSPNGFVTENSVGVSQGYDMLLDGAALAVAGVTDATVATIINYNSSTGARDTAIGIGGLQQFPLFGTGIIYCINTTTGLGTSIAGQANNIAFLRGILNSAGVLQDTSAPFNTDANGLILTTTIDQAGRLVVGGYYGSNAMAARYNVSGIPVRDAMFDGNGALLLTSLATTSSLNKIVNVGTGYLAAGQSNNQLTSVKITNAGVLDASYGNAGVVQETTLGTSTGVSVVVNTDGTLVVSGQSTVSGVLLPTLVAYTATGSRLPTFGINGVQTYGAIFGAGVLNDIITPRAGKFTTAGQMGAVATLMQVGQLSSLFDELNNGF